MRYARFDDKGAAKHAVVADAERFLDLEAAGLEGGAPAWQSEERALQRIVRAQPPSHALRRMEKLRILAPTEPQRVVLVGGTQDDFAPDAVVGHGASMPAGAWTTGVAAVVQDAGPFRKDRWLDHVVGFAPFHAVDHTVSVGPWIAGKDEVRDPLGLAFSAFVDDLSRIKPAKALLDWGTVFAEARKAGDLATGDIVCLAAPSQELPAGSDIRAALVFDGQVLARLENALA